MDTRIFLTISRVLPKIASLGIMLDSDPDSCETSGPWIAQCLSTDNFFIGQIFIKA